MGLGDGGGVFLPFGIKDEFSSPLKKMASGMKDFTRELVKSTSATRNQSKETDGATNSTKKWNAALGELAGEGLKKLNSFNARNLYRTFRDMPVVSLAVGEAFREGAKESMGFERAMLDLKLSGRASKDELSLLSGASKDLAINSKYGRTEILEQVTGLEKLGRSATEAFSDVDQAQHFSTLMNTSLKEGTDTAIKVSELYYGSASHIAEATDATAFAVKHARIPMDEFSAAIERIGPYARLSGASLQQTVGMLKVLTDSGVPANRAAVAVSRGMAEMAKVGLNAGKALSLIQKNYDSISSSAGKAAYLTAEFKNRNTSLIAPIFGGNGAGFAAFAEQMKEVDGYSKRSAALAEDLGAERLAKATNSIKESFTTLATPLVVGFSMVLEVFNKLPGVIKIGIAVFATLLAVVKPAMIAFKYAAEAWSILGKFGGIFSRLLAPFGDLIAMMGGFGSILSFIATKVALPISALFGLYKIVQLLKIGWDALTLSFEKKGLDLLPAQQRVNLAERQRAGLIDAGGNLTDLGKSQFSHGRGESIQAGRGAAGPAMVLHGPVHIHMTGEAVLKDQKGLAREMQTQLRAAGR